MATTLWIIASAVLIVDLVIAPLLGAPLIIPGLLVATMALIIRTAVKLFLGSAMIGIFHAKHCL